MKSAVHDIAEWLILTRAQREELRDAEGSYTKNLVRLKAAQQDVLSKSQALRAAQQNPLDDLAGHGDDDTG